MQPLTFRNEIYTVRDDFSELKEFTLNLPETFDRIGWTIQDNRNIVKKIITRQGTFVIKNFKGMYFFNRLAYSLFRKSKAARSYIYSGILNAKGIITPPHVSWIDCYKLGFLTQSYFVSVYYPFKTLQELLGYYDIYDESYKISLYRHLAAFALRLHNLGVYHDDFSSGNILVIQTHDSYQFALVDLNRIKFQKVNYRKGLHNLAKLRISPADMNGLIREYAIQSGEPAEVSLDMFWSYKKRSSSLRQIRRKIRRYTLTLFERIFSGKAFVKD